MLQKPYDLLLALSQKKHDSQQKHATSSMYAASSTAAAADQASRQPMAWRLRVNESPTMGWQQHITTGYNADFLRYCISATGTFTESTSNNCMQHPACPKAFHWLLDAMEHAVITGRSKHAHVVT